MKPKHVDSIYQLIASVTSSQRWYDLHTHTLYICVFKRASLLGQQLSFALFVHRTLRDGVKKSLVYANYAIKFPFEQTFWLSFLNSNSWRIDVKCLPSFIWFDFFPSVFVFVDSLSLQKMVLLVATCYCLRFLSKHNK